MEEYKNEEFAKNGHRKWINKIKENPEIELKQCRTAEEWITS